MRHLEGSGTPVLCKGRMVLRLMPKRVTTRTPSQWKYPNRLSSDAAFIDYWQYKRGTVYSNSQFSQFQYVYIEILQVPEKNIRNPNRK